MLILVTGATGKVGRNLIARLLDDPRFSEARIRALCHNRLLRGNRPRRGGRAARSPTATSWRAALGRRHPRRASRHLQGNARRRHGRDGQGPVLAARGIPGEPDGAPVHPDRRRCRRRPFLLPPRRARSPKKTPHMAYPGCYALSKVLEEVMLEQFGIQYDTQRLLPARAVDHGEGRFQIHAVVRRRRVRRPRLEDAGARRPTPSATPGDGTVPLLRDADGRPLKRNFVHVDDLVSAILAAIDNPRAKRQLFNICMDRPVDYGEVAAYLARTRGLDSIDIPSRFHSNWMDNSKAKYLLGLAAGLRSGNAYRLGLAIRAPAKRSSCRLVSGLICVAGTSVPVCFKGRNEMRKSTIARRSRRYGARRGPGALAGKKQLVIVVKGLDNPFFEAINQGCQKWNTRERQLGIRVLLHRPGIDLRRGRRGADRPGHARQGRHRGDGHFAVERQADRADDQDCQRRRSRS